MVFSLSEFACPFCLCNFVSKRDLDCHLAVFGDRNREAHLTLLRKVHRRDNGPLLSHDFLRTKKQGNG